jgi:formylglycine-generating enzyme required for sulfatase activity
MNCGPGGAGTESCCKSLGVAGGTFYRTYTNNGSGPTAESDSAIVANFSLDKYLVTVGRFRQFVARWKTGFAPAQGSGKHAYLPGGGLVSTAGGYETGWNATWNNTTDLNPTDANLACDATYATWTPSASLGHENLPINCVTWYEAYAFCIWDGGFLPSEAEWEYAAAGGGMPNVGQREFPWGSAAPGTSSQYAIYNCDYPTFGLGCTGLANLAPVGSAPMGGGAWGQLDLAGELWEWNLDGYQAAYTNPCSNCASVTAAGDRVIRGGFFQAPASPDLLPPNRAHDGPSPGRDYIGFRCARGP